MADPRPMAAIDSRWVSPSRCLPWWMADTRSMAAIDSPWVSPSRCPPWWMADTCPWFDSAAHDVLTPTILARRLQRHRNCRSCNWRVFCPLTMSGSWLEVSILDRLYVAPIHVNALLALTSIDRIVKAILAWGNGLVFNNLNSWCKRKELYEDAVEETEFATRVCWGYIVNTWDLILNIACVRHWLC